MKYAQESAGNGRVAPDIDYIDETNIVNEIRQVIEDHAIILGQETAGYPANMTPNAMATNVVKMNYEAEAAPTETNDSSEGYRKGSQWIYDGLYICIDNTVNNAVWKKVTFEEEA